MTDYYQYVIRVKGEVKWFFGTSDDIDINEITVEKVKGLDIPITSRLIGENDG